jgi:hypothetical protein
MVMVDKENPNALSFIRTAPIGSEPLLIVINMTSTTQTSTTQTSTVDLTGIGVKPGQLHTLLSTPKIDNVVNLGHIKLPPYAVVIATIH